MKVKVLEVRDRNTFIPMLCIDMNVDDPSQLYLLLRCGYPCDGRPNIAITRLSADGRPCWYDPYAWGDRTYKVAHRYILDNWERLSDGDVIDVEYILGESTTIKKSDRVT